MKRRILLFGALLLSLLLCGLSYWLTYTTSGLHALIALVNSSGRITITAAGLRGRAAGPLAAQRIEVRWSDDRVTIEDLATDLKLWDLLQGRLQFIGPRIGTVGIDIRGSDSATPRRNTLPALPMGIAVTDGELGVLRIGDKVSIRQLRMSATTRGRQVDIEALQLDLLQLHLEAHGLLGLHTAPSDLVISWRYTGSGATPSYAGTTHFEGPFSTLHTQTRLHTPVVLEAVVELNDLLSNPSWRGTLRGAPFPLQAVAAGAPSLTVGGDGQLHGSFSELGGAIDVAVTDPNFGSWQVSGKIALNRNRVRLDRAKVTRSGSNLVTTGGVSVDWGITPLRIESEGSWQQFQWPLDGAALVASREGKYRFAGNPEAYEFTLNGHLKPTPDTPDLQLDIPGTGNREGISSNRIRGTLLGGLFHGTGALNWSDGVAWEAALSGEGFTANLNADWPASFSAELTGHGRTASGVATTGDYRINAQGVLRDRPLSANLAFLHRAGTVSLQQLRIRSSGIQGHANGTIAEQLDIDWAVDHLDLAALLPDAAGILRGSGRLSGPRTAPQLDAQIAGSGLSYRDWQAPAFQGEVSGSRALDTPLRASLTIDRLQQGTRLLGDLHLALAGVPEAHELTAKLQGPEWQFDSRLTGALRDTTDWRGTLERASVAGPVGSWSLNGRGPLEIGPQQVTVMEQCWSQANAAGRICADGEWRAPDQIQVNAMLEGIDHAQVAKLLGQPLPAGVASTRLSASLREGQVTQATGHLEVRFADALAGERIAADLTADTQTTQLTLQLEGSELLSGDGQLTSPGVWRLNELSADRPVAGRLNLQARALEPFVDLLPLLGSLVGRADADLTLGGSLQDPRLGGRVTAHIDQFDLPTSGTRLTRIRAEARSSDAQHWTLSGDARVGESTLSMEGQAELNRETGWPATIKLTGKRLAAIDLPDLRATLSPDVTIRLQQSGADIDGSVTIDEADLQPVSVTSAPKISPDVVLVRDGVDITGTVWPVRYRVRLVLGDKVHFEGFGVNTRLTGALALSGAEPGSPTASGEVRLASGRFQSHGRELNITEGRVIFSGGPISNPGLDVRAQRQVAEVTVGAHVTGSAQQPRVELFSEPAMAEADILSYLILGVPMAETDETSRGELVGTATAISLLADTDAVRETRRLLGLEELRVEKSTDTGTAALVVGRYLSSRLYLSYSLGIADAVSALRLNYRLSKNWSLQTESGAASTGTDLLYTIEK